MTLTRKIWLALALFGILILSFAWWLIGTESGARWALARAGTYLPQEFVIGGAGGSLLGGLRIRSVEWRGDDVRVSADDVYLDVELIPLVFRFLDVNELRAARFELDIRESAEPDATPGMPTVDLPIDISIADARLSKVSIESASVTHTADEVGLAGSLFGSDLSITRLQSQGPRLGLDISGRVELTDHYAGRARAAWRLRQADQIEYAGDLQLQGDMRRYDLRHSLTAPHAVSTTGSISFDSGTLLADLTNEWQSLQMSIGERRLQSSTGSLRLQGSTNDYRVSLDANARLDDLPETRIELRGDADLQAIRISAMRLVNELGELSASGDAAWLPERTFNFDILLAGLDASRISESVSGTLDFDGNISGIIAQPAPQIELRIDRLGGDLNGHVIEGDAIVAYSQGIFAVSGAQVRLGSNSAEFTGSYGDLITLNADLDFAALNEVLPEASGSLRGHFALSGPKDRPDARIELTGAALQWSAYSVGNLSVDANIYQDKASIGELQLQQISIGDTVLNSARLSADGLLDKHSVRFRLTAFESVLSAEAEGVYSENLWSGRIRSLEIANEVLGRWSGDAGSELRVSVEEMTLSDTCLFAATDPGRACIGGAYRKESEALLNFSLTNFPLSAIPVDLPADANLSGFVDASLNIQSREQRLTGTAGVELRQAMVDAIYDGETISVSFSDASGEATITDNRTDLTLRLQMADGAGAGDLKLTVQDLSDRQSAIGGQGNVLIDDVSLFAVFLPGITNPRGKIAGNLRISGTLGQPEFPGEIALTEGAFAVRRAGIEVVDIDVRLSQRAPGRLQLRGRARSGAGQIRLQGDTILGSESGIRTVLILTGDNFELARLPEWQVAASPSIRAIFDERTTTISGALGIPTASITVNEIPETAESPSPDAIVHRPEGAQASSGRRIAIDVTTILGSDVRFSGFGLTAGVDGAVRIQGGSHDPWVGNGTLNLRDGRYKAYGQELEIERGELLFNGPLDNPQLDIRAIRRADDVVAGIQLSGTPSQLRSEVFSEPALSDAEALSYLLTGRPLSSTANAGEGDLLNNAAFALGMSGAGTIASQVRSGLGLETLTVEGGSDSGRIVAGKRFGNRLLVEYGYGVIDKLGTLLLRYQLSERIVLESRTGTVSNLDIVYSVKKK